jgi:hypothetical protein
MGIGGGAQIVKSGLVLALDAADPNSYPGSGNTWSDLHRGRAITLTNSPTFSSDGLGSISFNGTNQYGVFDYDSNFNLGTSFTLECWFNASSFTNIALMSKDTYGANQDWGIYFGSNTSMSTVTRGEFWPNNTVLTTTISPGLSTGIWHHACLSSTSGNVKTYINRIQYGSFSGVAWSNASVSKITVGAASWNNPNTFMNGKISAMRIYNRGLTEEEISRNYVAMRGRYGL